MIKITYFKKENGNTVYIDGKPSTTSRVVENSIEFRFGNYNEPKKVVSTTGVICDVNDIVSIESV